MRRATTSGSARRFRSSASGASIGALLSSRAIATTSTQVSDLIWSTSSIHNPRRETRNKRRGWVESGTNATLQRVDRCKQGAGDLVMAAQQPVGERQDLAAGLAAQRVEQHRAAEEDERRIAGHREGRRVPPSEVEGQE